MKVAVVNTKGGVGKTTTAVHLATLFAGRAPTLLIDADPQASAASWAAWRREAGHSPSPTTVVLAGKAVLTEGKNLAAGFTHTVVDAGGRDSAGLRAALLLADLALVPVGASNLDAAAMTDLLEVVELAKDLNPALQVRVLLTRLDPRTKRDSASMLEYLAENNLVVLSAQVAERVAFRRAIGDGSTVSELATDPRATAEMHTVFEEVRQ